MFAANVRIPWKILQSIIGVLPVAMSTIMVSPTARLSPHNRRENTRTRFNKTTRTRVCHWWHLELESLA